ncbi:MAG: phenylalanine--tRNA ligase subunit beta [Anaerolineaceae bacterium]|nr:phenylalanine--tRNA ligase subunit beta [Anaerolineaceae bacterium]
MKVPLSWIKDFVDLDLSLQDLARTMTMIGLEVDEVQVVGLPMPEDERREFKFTGMSWDPELIVVAQINEVLPHPNADRLVLCKLDDGLQEQTVLTGAPNLYPYKGKGPLKKSIKVAYAKEGAEIYDGHKAEQVLVKLKRTKIRGVESYSMACSEKELGISDEHEGIIFLDDDAPVGMSLVEYMGDAVFDIAILPNMSRDACMLGVARELAAWLGKPLRKPAAMLPVNGPAIEGKVAIKITDPELNPRFTFGLVDELEARPSPYWVQRRLRLAGMRPIDSIVDATNYVMLELGEPLHAFDYDVLVNRAEGKSPTIITRCAEPQEKLVTLDEIERTLEEYTILVTDTAGPLALAGVMGGLESEVTKGTRTVLLEGASWNLINTRRTSQNLRLISEASYRFSRGIHPELTSFAVEICLDRMAQWSGGRIWSGLVDEYPAPVTDPLLLITIDEVKENLGIALSGEKIADLLTRLEFECTVDGNTIHVQTPPHRLDIGTGIVGRADLMEEIARMYGYDNIPSARLADALPDQRANPALVFEEDVKDSLVELGLQEIVTYRLTSPEREMRGYPGESVKPDTEYVELLNPIAQDRSVMRKGLLVPMLEILERNIRLSDRLAFFEVSPVFLPVEGEVLPDEPIRLALGLTGLRSTPDWITQESPDMDFYDLKGVVEALLESLHVDKVSYELADHPSFHPAKSAHVMLDGKVAGVMGEVHPQVVEGFDLGSAPILVAELHLDVIFEALPGLYDAQPVPTFPPVLEDLAVIVDEGLPAARVVEVIQQAGGKMLTDIRLFDIYRGAQIGEGMKSLAYSLKYQAPDRTLTDKESGKIRKKIINRLDQVLGAKLRS